MANNSSSREVQLDVGVTTTGADAIRKLSADVRDLAKQGGDAAPEFTRLAEELDKLGAQSAAVENLNALAAEVSQLKTEQVELAAAAEKTTASQRELAAATTLLKDAEAGVAADLAATKNALADKRDELAKLRATTDASAKESDAYKAATSALRVEIIDLGAAVRSKRDALAQASKTVKDAASEERAMRDAAQQSVSALKASEGALTSRTTAVDSAVAAGQALGVNTQDLAAAQTELLQRFAATRDSIDAQNRAMVELAAQRERAATAARGAAAEEDRLLRVQERGIYELKRAAEEELAAERSRYAEATALAQRMASDKIAAEKRVLDFRAQAAKTADALESAFGAVGVRSAQALQREIHDVEAALDRLARNTRVTGEEFDRAFVAGQQRIAKLRAEMDGVEPSVGKTTKGIGFLKDGFRELAATYGAVELGQRFIEANVQVETLRRSLTLITGSTQAAASQIAFLRQQADLSGQSVGALADDFVRFNASAASSGISLEVMNGTFASVVNAMGVLGQDTQRTGLVLNALSQIANKGKVSLEELQGQLGESLPGALKITADGLGITTAELTKMVESGQLLSEDFFPAFQRGITGAFGGGKTEVEGFMATWNRLKNTIAESAQTIGAGGGMEVLAAGLKGLGVVAGAVIMGVSVALDSTVTAVKSAATLLAGVVQGDLKGAMTEVGRLTDDAMARQTKLAESFQAMVGIGDSVSASQGAVGAAIGQAGAASAQAVIGHTSNAAAQGSAAVAAGGNATAQTAAGAAVAAAGQQAGGATAGWVKLLVNLQALKAQTEEASAVSIKLAEAQKLAGETAVAAAKLSGDEVATRQAAMLSANQYAEAAAGVAQARQAEVDVLVKQLAAFKAEGVAAGGLSAAKQKQLADLEMLIEKKGAEAEKTREAAQAVQQEAAESRVAAQVYRDNSSALDSLRLAADQAQQNLRAVQVQQRQGIGTQAEVNVAMREAAEAQALYNDALKDSTAAAELKIDAVRRSGEMTKTALQVDLEKARTMEREAQLYGNAVGVTDARIKQKGVEIKITQANIDSMRAEATAIEAAAAARLAELEASGQLTPEKKAEVQARLDNAKALRLEADASAESIKQAQLEISAIRNKSEAIRSYTGTLNTLATTAGIVRTSLEGFNAEVQATQTASDAARQQRLQGQAATDNTGLESLLAKQRAGTLSAADLQTAQTVLQTEMSNQAQFQSADMIGFSDIATLRQDTQRRTQAQAILDYVSNLARSGGSGGGTTAPAPTGSSQTVNITINGANRAVNVASAADAQALVNLLKELEAQQGVSS